MWISRDWPRTPRTRSQVCTPGNGLPVCARLSPAGPRNSSQSDDRGSWSECSSSCHLAKRHPESPRLACDRIRNILLDEQPTITEHFLPTVTGCTWSTVTHLLSPSPSGGLFLSSGYTMTSLRLKWTISSRFSPVTFTSPGKKMEP